MKKSLLTTLALATSVFASTVFAEDIKKVTIATEGAYAPYNFKDASGNLVGFEIDLANDLCSRMNVECTIVEQAWDGIIPSLVSGRYDAIMAAMSIKPKREEVISFSSTYVSTPIRFVTLSSNDFSKFKTKLESMTFDDVSDEEKAQLAEISKALSGMKVGVQGSTTHADFMREFMPEIEVAEYDKIDNMILDLQAGRVDAGLGAMSFLKPLMDKEEGKDLTVVGPGMTKGPFGKGVAVGIRQEDAKLREMFSEAIEAALAEGVVSELAIKHFGFDNSTKK